MKSMISLVGRPNVGKSSLFNALLQRKQALVMDFEGVTRDRRFGEVVVEVLDDKVVKICDTGGWTPESFRKGREDQELLVQIEKQIIKALQESAVVVLVMDIRAGVTPLDEEIVRGMRKLNVPFVIAANKADKYKEDFQKSEFYALGAEAVIPVSAEHKLGMEDFWLEVGRFLPDVEEAEGTPSDGNEKVLKVCIVGRPNVGKSSLLNQMVGEERSVASSMPGTTTDPIDVTIQHGDKQFLLVDTAGIRRHARRNDEVEDLAVMYAQRNLDQADVAILVIDAEEGITSQDSRIAALVEESGCAAIVLANKWDLAPHALKSDSVDSIKTFRELMEKEWPFLDYAPLVAISAEKGKVYGAVPGEDAEDATDPWVLPREMNGIWDLAESLVKARAKNIPNSELTEVVEEALAIGPRWVEALGDFRRIHQVGNRPPQFLANVKDANKVPEALRRYLKRAIRKRYGYRGNPIRWVFRHSRKEHKK